MILNNDFIKSSLFDTFISQQMAAVVLLLFYCQAGICGSLTGIHVYCAWSAYIRDVGSVLFDCVAPDQRIPG